MARTKRSKPEGNKDAGGGPEAKKPKKPETAAKPAAASAAGAASTSTSAPRSTLTAPARTPVWEVKWSKITKVLEHDDNLFIDMMPSECEDAVVGSYTFSLHALLWTLVVACAFVDRAASQGRRAY